MQPEQGLTEGKREITGCYGLTDPGEMQHRAIAVLFFRLIGLEIAESSREGEDPTMITKFCGRLDYARI